MALTWVKLLRVKHWLKNLLVFFPLLFSGEALEVTQGLTSLAAFVSFCFASSLVYVVNDYRDRDSDRRHPLKSKRPLASGEVSVVSALLVVATLFVIAVATLLLFAHQRLMSLFVLIFYIVLNAGYSFGLKNIVIVDIGILAFGFFLRVFYGSCFSGIPVSSWLFLSVISLSFYFALGKRRGELRVHGSQMRASLASYSIPFLDKNMYMFLGLGLVFYSLWTFERVGGTAILDASSGIFASGVPLAMLACLRYGFDIERRESDGDPIEVVLGDKWLVGMVVLWFALMVSGLYVDW